MSKEITSFFKEAPYLKFTMPIPKSDKFVMGLPQSLVMYINSQTKKCAAQRSVMFVLLTTMDYDKAKAMGKIPFKVSETWICDLVQQEKRNYRETREQLIRRGWLTLKKTRSNGSNVLVVEVKKIWQEMLDWMAQEGYEDTFSYEEDFDDSDLIDVDFADEKQNLADEKKKITDEKQNLLLSSKSVLSEAKFADEKLIFTDENPYNNKNKIIENKKEEKIDKEEIEKIKKSAARPEFRYDLSTYDINELCYYKDHIDQLKPEKPIAPISYKQALYEKEVHDIVFISDTIIGIETKLGEYRLYKLEK